MRLLYAEFFSKFYEGGGRLHRPLKRNGGNCQEEYGKGLIVLAAALAIGIPALARPGAEQDRKIPREPGP
jgi:hypothetical protein